MESDDLRPQEVVLTLLGAYVHRQDARVWSGGLVAALGALGFSAGSSRIALTRLVARGLLARVREGRFVDYVPTDRARRLLAEGDARIFTLGAEPEWDGRWTLLWYAIPEALRVQRHRLGRRLRFAGFGSLEDGTWIAPHDRRAVVISLLESLDVTRHACLLSGTLSGTADADAVIAHAWDLAELATRYAAFAETYGGYTGRRLDDREAFVVRTRLVNSFRRFPDLDPGLPPELAPPGWRRLEAIQVFHELYGSLALQAQRAFGSLTRRPT